MVRASSPPASCTTCGGVHTESQTGRQLIARELAHGVQHSFVAGSAAPIQRKAEAAGAPPAMTSAVASAIARERGRGTPLSKSVAEPLQVRFGDDFSDVRVHANAGAAAALQARAFTVGSDIFFAAGDYHPGDHDGQRLLAHELTHVVQQRGVPVDVSTVEPQGSRAEREADAVANAVVAGREPKQVSAAPLGIPRDVGWARRGPIPDPNGIGYNTILAKAGDAFKDAILALASLETPSMFVNLEAYKKLPLQTRKAILALEPHAAGTACQGWFDVMRANDPDLKPTHTPAEIAAGEAAYYGASREVAVRHKVEEAKQAPGSMTGMDVEKKWSTNKYGLITLAQTPNHGLKADTLHAIWVSYWADRIKVAESTIDAMDQRQLHDPQHPDASDDPGYKQAEAVRDLGRSLLADSVGAIEICRAADAMGKSLTLDELDDHVIRHSKFMERLQLLTMVASTISASRGGRPRGRAARGRQSEPVKGEPVKTEPVKTEPVKTETATATESKGAASESAPATTPSTTATGVYHRSVEFTPSTGRTYKVFQRNDINWDQIRTAGDRRFIGKTNAEAARAGLRPQLPDGNFVTLHHSQQSARGPWFETSTKVHNISTAKEPPLHPYRGAQHPDFPLGRGPGSLRDAFQRVESPEYWKWREQHR